MVTYQAYRSMLSPCRNTCISGFLDIAMNLSLAASVDTHTATSFSSLVIIVWSTGKSPCCKTIYVSTVAWRSGIVYTSPYSGAPYALSGPANPSRGVVASSTNPSLARIPQPAAAELLRINNPTSRGGVFLVARLRHLRYLYPRPKGSGYTLG